MNSLCKVLLCMTVCIAYASAYDGFIPDDRCVVVSKYSYEVDCSLAYLQEPLVPLEPSATVFSTLEAALAWCSHDPMIIDIMGTVYITDAALNNKLMYLGVDIVINGIDYVDPEDESKTRQSALVGLSNFKILDDNTSVTFNNLLIDGCGTKDSIFFSKFDHNLVSSEYHTFLAPFFKEGGLRCFLGRNLIIENSTVTDYAGPMAVCHINPLVGKSTIRHNNFFDISGHAVAISEVEYDVSYNTHCKCGKKYKDCYFINRAALGYGISEYVFSKNVLCDADEVSIFVEQLSDILVAAAFGGFE